MSARFHIRVATLEDIPALHQLIEASVRQLQTNEYTAEQRDGALGHVFGVDTQLIQDQTYFVACPAEQPTVIAGCGGWSFRKTLFGSDHGPGRIPEVLDPTADAAKIRAIFIHPEWARQGLGSLILEHCENAAQNAGFGRFEMGSTLTGVALYALKGYREEERIEVPLPNGSLLPIVHMVKLLKGVETTS
ncbi:GNAT family N-acetyltransferase [Terriglobus sp. TAA 43]|uniref:GNAT family N-acetyltransferase n=1 Tax=Terriglobus sp. TAA 43 TaxID=278961 RepID=UPI00064551A7|nr:GNAT family N-acetyltransferase [Terriglobus sp. TAA 43]